MGRYLCMYVALAVAASGLFGQAKPQDQSTTAASQQQQVPVQPRLHRYQESDRVPAAQYSPLAAQGGYSRTRTSPLEAMVHALNPRDVNLGTFAGWPAAPARTRVRAHAQDTNGIRPHRLPTRE